MLTPSSGFVSVKIDSTQHKLIWLLKYTSTITLDTNEKYFNAFLNYKMVDTCFSKCSVIQYQ